MKGLISFWLGAFILLATTGLSGCCCMFKKKAVNSQSGVTVGGAGSISTGMGTMAH